MILLFVPKPLQIWGATLPPPLSPSSTPLAIHSVFLKEYPTFTEPLCCLALCLNCSRTSANLSLDILINFIYIKRKEINQFYPLGLKPEHINLNERASTVLGTNFHIPKFYKDLWNVPALSTRLHSAFICSHIASTYDLCSKTQSIFTETCFKKSLKQNMFIIKNIMVDRLNSRRSSELF